MTESELQAAIKDALTLLGFDVLSTSAFRQKGPSGVMRGVPDLLYRHPSWPRHVLQGMEIKRDAKAHVSPEQQKFSEAGWYPIVWSVRQAIDAADSAYFRHMHTSETYERRLVALRQTYEEEK